MSHKEQAIEKTEIIKKVETEIPKPEISITENEIPPELQKLIQPFMNKFFNEMLPEILQVFEVWSINLKEINLAINNLDKQHKALYQKLKTIQSQNARIIKRFKIK